jgi:hypothetical protein
MSEIKTPVKIGPKPDTVLNIAHIFDAEGHFLCECETENAQPICDALNGIAALQSRHDEAINLLVTTEQRLFLVGDKRIKGLREAILRYLAAEKKEVTP